MKRILVLAAVCAALIAPTVARAQVPTQVLPPGTPALTCDGSDDSPRINAALSGPASDVLLLHGVYKLQSTLVLGNGTPSTPSTIHFLKLCGVGGGMAPDEYFGVEEAGTTLLWCGPPGGTMLETRGPIVGPTLCSLHFDANGTAANAIDLVWPMKFRVTDVSGTAWTGIGLNVRTRGTVCPPYGAVRGVFDQVDFTAPASRGAIALNLGAPTKAESGCTDPNNLSFHQTRWTGGEDGVGIALRYVDLVAFSGSTRVRIRHNEGTGTGIGIFVVPDSHEFPTSISFHGLALSGGQPGYEVGVRALPGLTGPETAAAWAEAGGFVKIYGLVSTWAPLPEFPGLVVR